ncbi:MAG: phosphotransferase, partial [Proteobacteria bacterium]|nr:phosphotransferase [Pseudomonadota bacterium]
MQFHDPLCVLGPERLSVTLAGIGLPQPTKVSLFQPAGSLAMYRISFDGVEDHLLTLLLRPTSVDPLHNESAALSVLQSCDEVPVAKSYRILDSDALGLPASLQPLVQGIDGATRIAQRAGDLPAVARDLGAIAHSLANQSLSGFGLRGDGIRYLPYRSNWAAEWQMRVETARRHTLVQGTDLGPLGADLYRRATERLGILTSPTFALVHGWLVPSNLVYNKNGPEFELGGVLNWGKSMAGDSLVEWARVLLVDSTLLGGFVEGYGVDEARSLLEPDSVRRLELYLYTDCLLRLAHVQAAEILGKLPHGAQILYRARE